MQFYLSHNVIRPHHFSNILAWLRLCIMGAGSQFRSLNKEHEAMFFLRSLAVLAPTRQPSAHPIHWSSMLYQSAPLPSLPQGSCGLQYFWFDLNLCFFLSLSLSLFLSPLSLSSCVKFLATFGEQFGWNNSESLYFKNQDSENYPGSHSLWYINAEHLSSIPREVNKKILYCFSVLKKTCLLQTIYVPNTGI